MCRETFKTYDQNTYPSVISEAMLLGGDLPKTSARCPSPTLRIWFQRSHALDPCNMHRGKQSEIMRILE